MMKKLFFFGMMGAMALTFSACSSEDDMAAPQLTGESVKATITFNIPTAKNSTRMTAGQAGETQNTTFTGIESISLIPFSTTAAIAGTDAIALNPITLEDISAWDEQGVNNNSFNGKIYNDVTVPVGVNHFLFYGKATGSNSEGELDATIPTAQGSTVSSALSFAMVPKTDATVATLAEKSTQSTAVLEALQAVSDAFETQVSAATTAGNSAAGILDEMKATFETNVAGSAASVQALFEDLSASLTAIGGDYATAVKNAITDLSSNDFPADLDLPDGAVGVKCTKGDWAFDASNTNGLGQPELDKYVKPADLWYTVNTPINVDKEKQQPNYAAQSAWTGVVALYGDGTAVTSETRAIVLDNEIQFAVAQLKSNVIVNAGNETNLKANDGTSENNLVDVVATTDVNFTVSAVLIGQQANLDWAFMPTGTANLVVYDPVQTGSNTTVSTTATDWNYTLVGETEATEVFVLVELINNLQDADKNPIEFFGYNDQLIPAGGKFYLLGKLKVDEADTKPDGLTTVFKQDYTTQATFTIGAESLKNAYNTIPDLRTPELELGLGVNLEWQPGLVFNSVPLAGLDE